MTASNTLALLQAAIVCVGCDQPRQEAKRTAPAGARVEAPTPRENPVVALGDTTATPTLLEAGRAPRRQLVYRPHAGARTTHLELAILPPGVEAAQPETTTMLVLSWTSGASPSGDWRYDFQVQDARLQAAPPAAGKGELAAIAGVLAMYRRVAGYVVTSPRGAAHLVQVEGGPTRPSLPWLLFVSVVPLPKEPVGVGARWRTVQTYSLYDAEVTDTREMELLALEDDAAKVRITGDISWRSPSGRASTKLTGTADLKMSDLIPQTVDIRMEETAEARTVSDGGPITFAQSYHLAIE